MPDIEFTCPECGGPLVMDGNGAGQTVACPHCTAPIYIEQEDDGESAAAAEPPLPPYAHGLAPDAQKLPRDTLDHHEAQRIWHNRQLWGHGITGILAFFILGVLFGMPSSLHPGALLLLLVTSCVFGLPSGLLISLLGGGVATGVTVCSSIMILDYIGMAAFSEEGLAATNLLSSVGSGLLGALIGAVIGKHVELTQ